MSIFSDGVTIHLTRPMVEVIPMSTSTDPIIVRCRIIRPEIRVTGLQIQCASLGVQLGCFIIQTSCSPPIARSALNKQLVVAVFALKSKIQNHLLVLVKLLCEILQSSMDLPLPHFEGVFRNDLVVFRNDLVGHGCAASCDEGDHE